MNIYDQIALAQKLSHKKASDLETVLNRDEREGGGDWLYSMEPTSHEKQFVIAVYDGDNLLLGYL